MGGSFALAIATPLALRQDPVRKSTDPPLMSRGKYCQDLFMAIDRRDTKAVKDLLKSGADPNSRNGLEFTPLYIAAASWQPDVVQILLDAGAKVNVNTTYGNELTFAAFTGDLPAAQILLAKGSDPKLARFDGMTPLMMAANAGAAPFVAELLKHKVDVNAKAECGSTALTYAARGGYVEVAKQLLEAGASPNTFDENGETALMEAAATGHADIVKVLLDKGAKVDQFDRKHRTALIYAVNYSGSPEVVKALIDGGAKPAALDEDGRSAQAIAALRRQSQCQLLLGKPSADAIKATGKIRSADEAIPVSLNAISSSITTFSQSTGCVSCHQEGLGRIALGEAKDRGYKLDQKALQLGAARVDGTLNALKPLHEGALHSDDVMKQLPLREMNEYSTLATWLLAGCAAQKEPADAANAAMAMVLAKQQAPNGAWTFSLPRVPMQSSNFTFTALAIRSILAYAPASASAEIKTRVADAKKWLLATPAKNNEDQTSKLLGLNWAGGSKAELSKASAELIAGQNADGGWSQMPNTPSDAYATGRALYALHVGGALPTSDPTYKKGVAYLLKTQDPDGTWFTAKRAIPANNYFDGGFPHGESQYASFNATCWATMALMQTVKPR